MLDGVWDFLGMLCEMSPFLLLGFLIAGVMHAFIPRKFFANYLSHNSLRSVLYAVLMGVPLPLCSCGVVPTAVSMRREGASIAATVAFLIATPQTGVDSILATAALLGVPFAVIRPVAAFLTAIFGGALVVLLYRSATKSRVVKSEVADSEDSRPKSFWGRCIEALRYGFLDMMQDIGRWLILGLAVAAMITILVPDGFFASFNDKPLLSMLLVLLFSVPMYLCATGSIPIAAALILKGLSPGAALVLLMAGPATNAASIIVVGKSLGGRALCIYLLSIMVGAVAMGLVIDTLLPREWFLMSQSVCTAECHSSLAWYDIVSTVVLLLLLVVATVRRVKTSKRDKVNMKNIYRIKGMMCNHCKANVERTLSALEGVVSVSVDLAAGEATVEGSVERQRVIDAIRSMGYEYVEE